MNCHHLENTINGVRIICKSIKNMVVWNPVILLPWYFLYERKGSLGQCSFLMMVLKPVRGFRASKQFTKIEFCVFVFQMLSSELINQILQFFSGMSIKGAIPDIFINVGYLRHLVISNSVPQHLLKLFQKRYSLIFFFLQGKACHFNVVNNHNKPRHIWHQGR